MSRGQPRVSGEVEEARGSERGQILVVVLDRVLERPSGSADRCELWRQGCPAA